METNQPTFSNLFAQLGLPCEEQDIRQFIETHSPLSEDIKLTHAPFWTPAQMAFLHEAYLQDSDWVEVVDQLNVALRKPESPSA